MTTQQHHEDEGGKDFEEFVAHNRITKQTTKFVLFTLVGPKYFKQAHDVTARSFVSILPADQLRECSAIEDPVKRRDEIQRRLKEHTKGRITSLDQGGSPLSAIGGSTLESFTRNTREIFERSLRLGYFFVIATADDHSNIVATRVCEEFDPIERLAELEGAYKDPNYYPDIASMMRIRFLREVVYGTRWRGVYEKDPKTGRFPAPIFHTEYSAVSNDWRGFGVKYEFQFRMKKMQVQCALKRGLTLEYNECVHPIIHHVEVNLMGLLPLFECSFKFSEYFDRNGKKPYPIEFKSMVAGADSTYLITANDLRKVKWENFPEELSKARL